MSWHLGRPILLPKIESGEIDPTFVITHTLPLGEAPKGYQIFDDKVDGCIKVRRQHLTYTLPKTLGLFLLLLTWACDYWRRWSWSQKWIQVSFLQEDEVSRRLYATRCQVLWQELWVSSAQAQLPPARPNRYNKSLSQLSGASNQWLHNKDVSLLSHSTQISLCIMIPLYTTLCV